MVHVELKNFGKKYGKIQVIEGLNLSIEEGEFTVFVGPSGCGKSTLLRMIAGLEDISDGDITISGRRVNDETPTERGISMVFQNYALYPHMTVEQNIAFGLKMSGYQKEEIQKKVADAAETLQLEPYLKRKPAALSGGQRQRVAIGRAIVREPQLFLFDEPLSNLDAELRVSMRMEIAGLHRQLKSTMIYVTHDQTEAMTLADKIVVLRDGKIEQVGTPQELYEAPCNTFVAGFIGSPPMNMIPGTLTDLGHFDQISEQMPNIQTLGIRPEDVVIGDAVSPRMLTVDAVEYLGGTGYIYGRFSDDTRLTVEMRSMTTLDIGDKIPVSFPVDRLHAFSSDGMRVQLPESDRSAA